MNQAVEDGLVNAYREAVKAVTGAKDITIRSASTDANIPMSLGVAGVDAGVYVGAGAHTREEWIEKDSVVPGLEISIRYLLSLTE